MSYRIFRSSEKYFSIIIIIIFYLNFSNDSSTKYNKECKKSDLERY